jgi:hypothetical protein
MAQPDSGWHNNSEEDDQGGAGLNQSPNDSEDYAPLSPAFRVNLANHDKNSSVALALFNLFLRRVPFNVSKQSRKRFCQFMKRML